MKQLMILVLTFLIVFAIAVPVTAQEDESMYERELGIWKFRMGVLYPTGNTVDNAEFTFGLEFEDIADHSIRDMSGTLSLSIDYTRITTIKDSGQDDIILLPILASWKRYLTPENSRTWYYGFGLGIYWAEDPIPSMDISDNANLAWQLMMGSYITPSWSVDIRYIAGDNPAKDGLFAVEVGYSF